MSSHLDKDKDKSFKDYSLKDWLIVLLGLVFLYIVFGAPLLDTIQSANEVARENKCFVGPDPCEP